ncbi:hypothetical protein L3X38_027039 [Prunus dulcis]|uniref:MPN domain-containing protein n=1 Tax=Prunus dulcis TaxID=3755 RepID=A0AAD4VNE9_PRUDU|nr:hypothetical protein L3X38_027039 [Prunus dulcis]
MGLLLGSFPDEYTTHVVDVVAMPQRGTGVNAEAIDHVFQTDMLDMLKQTQRHEMVVGWYHSHPGFGCWLCGAASDSFVKKSLLLLELFTLDILSMLLDHLSLLYSRSFLSVKGKVVIDAFRLINPNTVMLGQEPHPILPILTNHPVKH